MQYDGEKYYYGTKFINNADGLLTDIYKATDNIKGYHGFEYKDILNEIKMTIFEVMSDCTAISNTIEMGRQNIASMNSDFDVQYLEASHYDFSNMSVTEQEENRYLIKYTDEEIARELKKHQNNAANVDISDEALRTSMMLNDQNFSNLSVDEQQDQIDNFRDEVIKYQKMSWYEKALKNTGAFVGGAANGLANVVESVVDGAATLTSAYVLYATPVGQLMSVASQFQEQSGVAKDNTIVDKYKEKVKDFVDKNWADDIYDGIVEKYGMNKYICKGKCYTTGKTVGTMAGYTGLSFIPGGPVVTGIVTGLAAAGDAAETAYNNGASYDQGVVAAGVAGGVGFLSGAALDKIRGASKLVTTKAGVLAYALLGSGTAMSEPVVNAVAQYNLYAKNQIDENGNKVYNNFGDYFKKSGGLQSTFMAAGIGGASILPSAVKNYKLNNYTLNTLNRINNIPSLSAEQNITVEEIFKKEQKVAFDNQMYYDNFKTYREHAKLHTQLVREYAVKLGLELDNIDDNALAEIFYGAYFHDLGMAGGGKNSLGHFYGLNYKKKGGEFLGLINNVISKDTGESWSFLAGKATRDNHPLNSAISILSDDIVPKGLDKDKIALLAMSHSKSTSGITSFIDANQWNKAIDKLDDAVCNYNKINNLTGADAIVFDAERLKTILKNKFEFNKLIDQALCIRDGDAMAALALTKDGHTIMQTGTVAHVDSPKISSNNKVPILDDEINGIVDIIKDKNGKFLFTVDDKFGKLFHAGEENVNFKSSYDGKKYFAEANFVDIQKVPNSSSFVIRERLGELATYTNCERKFKINIPKYLKGTEYGKSYLELFEKTINEELNDAYLKFMGGRISAEQFDSIKNFYKNSIEVPGFEFKINWSDN